MNTKIQWMTPESLVILNGNNTFNFTDTIESDFIRCEFQSTTIKQSSTKPDLGMLASIDGCSVNWSPFNVMKIPPPMSWMTSNFDGNVMDVTFLPYSIGGGKLYSAVVMKAKIHLVAFSDKPLTMEIVVSYK